MSLKRTVFAVIGILILITLLHAAGLAFGLYARGVPIDVPQHILAGMCFAIIWYSINRHIFRNAPVLVVFFSLISFAVFAGVLWEFFEFALSQSQPSIAQKFAMMSPVVAELLHDLVADMLGGVIVGLVVLFRDQNSLLSSNKSRR